MPAELTYPGVYIEEQPSGVRPIIGVSTSITAFVGRARKGPVDEPVLVHSFADYERIFGGLWNESRMSFALRQYFQNGGRDAVIVRVTRGVPTEAATSTFTFTGAGGDLELEASSPGEWGDNLQVALDTTGVPAAGLFNLTVVDPPPNGTDESETLRNLSLDPAAVSFVTTTLEQRSRFLRVAEGSTVPASVPTPAGPVSGTGGEDGDDVRAEDVMPPSGRAGVRALDTVDIFNLLCLPPLSETADVPATSFNDAAAYLRETTRRAMLLVDTPSAVLDVVGAIAFKATLDADENAALFFPRLRAPNPLKGNLSEEFVASGAVAGVFARTDAERGVWKAPAGTEATIVGTTGLALTLTDAESGQLNPVGINALRTFPLIGRVIWGSRTLRGADALTDQWKYIPIRRLALFIEETLFRATQWVVFEPNDEPLWGQIRLNVGAFMNGLFRQGAFQGTTPAQAYFVKCDSETTTQADIDRGVVNVVVGFAPLKPAEFVVLKIQQMAGQIAA
ncbi:MAG: phage tail sheath family protein [Gaiellaceae bacterium]